MKSILTVLLTLTSATIAFSQSDAKIVKAEEKISDVFTTSDIFRFEKFSPGKVFFKDGTSADAQLNYNRYFEQMMFLDPNGDSLALANPELVNVIVVGNRNFYYAGEVILEELADYGDAKIAVHEALREIDKKVLGAYGSTANSNSISYFKHQYTIDGKPAAQKPGEGTLFSKKKQLYVGDSFNHFVPASKKAVEALYGKKTKELKAYLKENPVDYSRAEDLQRLCQYMQSN